MSRLQLALLGVGCLLSVPVACAVGQCVHTSIHTRVGIKPSQYVQHTHNPSCSYTPPPPPVSHPLPPKNRTKGLNTEEQLVYQEIRAAGDKGEYERERERVCVWNACREWCSKNLSWGQPANECSSKLEMFMRCVCSASPRFTPPAFHAHASSTYIPCHPSLHTHCQRVPFALSMRPY